MNYQNKATRQLMSELEKQKEEIAALKRMAVDLKQVQQSLVERLRIQELISKLCIDVTS